MSHLGDRALGLYAIDPARVSPAERAHLDRCGECQAALRDLRQFEELLREPETWIGLSGAAPRAINEELRAFAVRVAEEDEEALRLLEEFKDPSAAGRFVWTDIASKPEYQSGGVARVLCRWANGMCSRDPLYALKLAEAATVISQTLPDDDYPRDTIHELRGEALKEQANALLSLGRLNDALQALDTAEGAYATLSRDSSAVAAVKYIRGAVHYEQEQLEKAERAAEEAAELAQRFGDHERYMLARHLFAHVLLDRHRYAAAAEAFEDLLRYGQSSGNNTWIARESLAMGICYIEMHRYLEADRCLHQALGLFTRLGFAPDVTRTQWAIARVLFAQGSSAEAIYRLQQCIREFTSFKMVIDAALVAVDLAEMLNAAGRAREIPKVLANAAQVFVNAGKFTSALTALAYLREAAVEGAISPQLVAYVRRFVQRSERQPELLFLPPPEPL